MDRALTRLKDGDDGGIDPILVWLKDGDDGGIDPILAQLKDGVIDPILIVIKGRQGRRNRSYLDRLDTTQ